VLGTVQFGLKYGVAHKKVKVEKREVFSILDLAYKKGIDILDTAYSYGASENRIGEFISQAKSSFNVISKMPDLTGNGLSGAEDYCLKSLKRLKQPRLYGYLVHRFDNILKYKKLWKKLESLKQKQIVKKIGVSLYNTEELEYLLNEDIIFDIIQFPYSIFDQRVDRVGFFEIAKKNSIEVFARSAFLQGLFFMPAEKIPPYLEIAKPYFKKLDKIIKKYIYPDSKPLCCFLLKIDILTMWFLEWIIWNS